jgi:hypothetical protein
MLSNHTVSVIIPTYNHEKYIQGVKSIIAQTYKNTVSVKTILNIDIFINKILDKNFIHLPGLSLLAICKKV